MVVVHNYHAAATGSTVRQVHCEKCGCDYEYELIRRAEAYTSSLYSSKSTRHKVRAAKATEAKLAKLLKTAVDPVACPDCGWYQANMVREFRRRQFRPLYWLGTLPPLFALATIGLFLGLSKTSLLTGLDKEDIKVLWEAAACAVITSCLFLGLREFLVRLRNLNSHYPEIPPPLRGAPNARRRGEPIPIIVPPAVEIVDTTGALGYERRRPEVIADGWITVQLARTAFPPVCCNCMTQTSGMHRYQPQSTVFINVRMCPDCSRRENRKLELCIMIGLVVGCLIIGPASFWLLDTEGVIRRLIYSAMGGLGGGAAIGILIYRILSRSSVTAVGFRNFKSDLNTIELRFRNRGYTDLFLDAQRAPATPSGGAHD